MRPLHKQLKQLAKKLRVEEDENYILVFTKSTPLNWRDIIAVKYEQQGENIQRQIFIFKDGVDYVSQNQIDGVLTDEEEQEAKKYIESFSSADTFIDIK